MKPDGDGLRAWARDAGVALDAPADFPALSSLDGPTRDFGKLVSRTPTAVLRPADQAQLAAVLAMCRDRRIPLKTRGAGHSSCGQVLITDGVVVDLRGLNRIVGDAPDRGEITVEAGCTWLELCAHLRLQGRRPLVLTGNWRTTVGGTLAVGGFGDTSHLYGPQVATVRALTVMTLDGVRHTVRPGDALFDYALAGCGQVGVITEATLATLQRPATLTARVLTWTCVDDFLTDAATLADDGRFEVFKARLGWQPGCPVGAAVGNFGDAEPQDALAGLRATAASPVEQLDYDAAGGAEPDPADGWDLACPAVEVVLPLRPDTATLIRSLGQQLAGLDPATCLRSGSAIMWLPAQPRVLPLAPLPSAGPSVMLAIRPALSVADARAALPTLRHVARTAMDAGGKLYLMSIDVGDDALIARQLGVHLAPLRALRAQHDPHDLLNAGRLPPL